MTKSARNRKTSKFTPLTEEKPAPSTAESLAPPPEATTAPTASENPASSRSIEVRLALPQPQVRYENGKPVRDPAPDPNRIIAAIQPDLERSVQEYYGAQTEVVLLAASVASIRITGFFGEKAKDTQARVQGWLDMIFENLDLGE